MKITILGSASGMAVANRNSSAYLVETKHRIDIIDAGDGMARQLVSVNVDSNQIRSVFISHTHSDHVSGLFPLLQWMHLTGRKIPLDIYLPRGVLPGFETIFPYFQIFQDKWPFRFNLRPITPGLIVEDEGFQIHAIPNGHLAGNQEYAFAAGNRAESYSFCFWESEERRVIYTSDVDMLAHLETELALAKVLITECTHISIEVIRDIGRRFGIPRIILTHIPPELEEESTVSNRHLESENIVFAQDGFIIEV